MKIAIGNSRMEKNWQNREMSWEEFLKRVGTTIYTKETVSEFASMPRNRSNDIKDVGGFVGGHLREGKRRNGHILCRELITLDADYATPDFWANVQMLTGCRCCIYSTHKHTPEQPRFRLVIPLAREVSEDEYPTLSRMVAREIGIDLFDKSTHEPVRLMYWPSTPSDGEFVFEHTDGPLLDPDEYLRRYKDWQDVNALQVSSQQHEVVKRSLRKQADPLKKPGVIGAFCRAYNIEETITQFLSDVYKPSSIDGRFDYIPADSTAGVVVYDGKFAYSHHATDPAYGLQLNAFDLVRVHRFRNLDKNASPKTPIEKLPSFKAMTEFAISNERVKQLLAEERQAVVMTVFDDELDWRTALALDKNGAISGDFGNFLLILNHDPKLVNIAFKFKSPKVWYRSVEREQLHA